MSLWLYIISIPINIFNSPWQVGRLRQVLAVIYIIIITTVFVVIIILEIQKVRVILKFVADTVSKMRQLLFLFICLPPLLNTKEASLSISWCLLHRKCIKRPDVKTIQGEVPRKKSVKQAWNRKSPLCSLLHIPRRLRFYLSWNSHRSISFLRFSCIQIFPWNVCPCAKNILLKPPCFPGEPLPFFQAQIEDDIG